LKPALDRANTKPGEEEPAAIPPFRWHDFRHYAVSTLIARRVLVCFPEL
jgi:hypothetical protein